MVHKATMILTTTLIKLKSLQPTGGKQGIHRQICLIEVSMNTIRSNLRRRTFPQILCRRLQWMGTGRWAWLRRLDRCKYSIISTVSSWTTELLLRGHQKISKGSYPNFRIQWTTTTPPKPRTLSSITALYLLKRSHLPTSTNLLTTSHRHHLWSKPTSALVSLSPTLADAKSYNNNVRKNRNCSSSWTLADTTRKILKRHLEILVISKMPQTEQVEPLMDIS